MGTYPTKKYKANENTSRHNPKKITKTNNQQKSDKDPMQSRHNPKNKQKTNNQQKSGKDRMQRGLMAMK